MSTKTQTTATGAPAWAMPGCKVAFFNGYGEGKSYTTRTVARHTKTMIILEPVGTSSYSKETAFKLHGDTWHEYGEKSYRASIAELGGERTTRVDRANNVQAARREVQVAAEKFLEGRRWTGIEQAKEMQAALAAFITTMEGLGEK